MVSILVPAYNSKQFIEETLLSCVNQDYTDVEIIVVDDGSTDGTLDIAKRWESRHKNIYVISQQNKGACAARNLALEKSSGEYVMFLDADNIISPNKVKEQMELLTAANDDMAVATCPWDRFYNTIEDAKFPNLNVYKDYDNGFDMLLDLWNHSEMFETACYLISRKLAIKAGEWVVGLKKNQDGEYFSRVLANASKILFCPEGKLYYRTGDYDSVSKGSSKAKIEALLDSLIRYKQSALLHEDSKRVKVALTRNFSMFMYLYYGQHPDLCAIAKSEIKSMGQKPLPSGTKRTKQLSGLIGLENFLRFRKLFFNR